MVAGDSGGGGERLAADGMYLQPAPRAASAGRELAPPARWAPREGRTPLGVWPCQRRRCGRWSLPAEPPGGPTARRPLFENRALKSVGGACDLPSPTANWGGVVGEGERPDWSNQLRRPIKCPYQFLCAPCGSRALSGDRGGRRRSKGGGWVVDSVSP